jgi:hypothetical protein
LFAFWVSHQSVDLLVLRHIQKLGTKMVAASLAASTRGRPNIALNGLRYSRPTDSFVSSNWSIGGGHPIGAFL